MRRLFLIMVSAGLALAVYGVRGAQQAPAVVRYRLAMPGLAAPLRIVQLSDSHASRIDMPPDRLAGVVAQINALRPDIVLLTGDYISGESEDWSAAQTRAALQPFAALHAPLGVFAVPGNHDDPEKTRAGFAGGAVRLLVGNRVDAGPIQIVGADSIMRGSPAVEAMRDLIRTAPVAKPLLVVVHEPVFFVWLQQRPVLMIAGHTHGGQIKLPFLPPWSNDPYYGAHQRGLFQEGPQRMLVSSGLGTTALPIRIGVPPEIVELTLVSGPTNP